MPLIFAKSFLEPCQTLCEAHRLLQRHSLWCNCGVWSLCPSSGGQMDIAWQPHGMAWHGVAWRGMCILTDLLAWEGIASDCWAVICNGLWESVQFHMKSRSATIRDSEWANFYYLLVVNDLIVTRSDKWESDSWRSPDFRLSLTSHLWALWREWPQNAFASWIVLQHCWTKPRNTLKLCRAALLGTGPGSDASRPTCSTSGQRRWQMTLWHLNNSNTLDMKPFDAFWPLLTPFDAFQISTVCKIGQAALQTIFTMIDLHI